MTDREQLNLLWNNHNAHVDEHRYLSKEIDRLKYRIRHLEKILQDQFPALEVYFLDIPE